MAVACCIVNRLNLDAEREDGMDTYDRLWRILYGSVESANLEGVKTGQTLCWGMARESRVNLLI